MKVKFLPMDVELEIKPDQSVMNLAHENDIPVHSVCNGMPSCAECRVKLTEGDHNVLPPSAKELSLIGTGHFIDQRRLSCQLLCFGDITVDLSEQVEKAAEGKVNKKFLQRAQKEAADSHAAEGILIEQDDEFKDISTSKDGRGSATDKVVGQQDKDFYGKLKGDGKSAKDGGGGGGRGDKRKRNNRRRRSGGGKGKGGGGNRSGGSGKSGGGKGGSKGGGRSGGGRSGNKGGGGGKPSGSGS